MGAAGLARTDRTTFINRSFLALAALSVALFGISIAREGALCLSSLAIVAALLAAFWYFAANSRVSAAAIIAAQSLILLEGLGAALSLFSWRLAGVTFDTYLHLLGGFACALLAAAWLHDDRGVAWERALGFAFALTIALGLGLEWVELLDVLFNPGNGWSLPACARSFCAYWQDTAKDVLNDALGALLALAALHSGRLSAKQQR